VANNRLIRDHAPPDAESSPLKALECTKCSPCPVPVQSLSSSYPGFQTRQSGLFVPPPKSFYHSTANNKGQLVTIQACSCNRPLFLYYFCSAASFLFLPPQFHEIIPTSCYSSVVNQPNKSTRWSTLKLSPLRQQLSSQLSPSMPVSTRRAAKSSSSIARTTTA